MFLGNGNTCGACLQKGPCLCSGDGWSWFAVGVAELERSLGSSARDESKKGLLVGQVGLMMQIVAEKNQVYVGGMGKTD